MFSKKIQADVRKSAQKISDTKKDLVTRYKHLRNVLGHSDAKELKVFIETNYTTIYHIFYENFIVAETNLKQRELPFHLVHKAHREELEAVLYVLDKILTFCPELISVRWQCCSLTYILTKLLHPANSWKLRREAIKYFILWYQVLGDNATDNIHAIFSTLVPGFPSPFETHPGLPALVKPPSTGSVFHSSPVSPMEISPLYPPPSGEKQPEDEMRYFLDALLEFMVSQVPRINWNDASIENKAHYRCFIFLFEKFKKYYLPHIFPDYSESTNVYEPTTDIPEPRSSVISNQFVSCRICVIKWIANYTHGAKQRDASVSSISYPAYSRPSIISYDSVSSEQNVSTSQEDSNSPSTSLHPIEETLLLSSKMVRDVFYSCRENVNFILEIYRQAFLLNFDCSPAIRRTIAVYKDWIQMNVSELPPFLLEPLEGDEHSSIESTNTSTDDSSALKPIRLRNDSYVGAINRDNLYIRAGLQNVLQLFITHAANVFLLEISGDNVVLLEEQVDTCKRVLNMYRYMVMHIHMESKTWEQLLTILLKITSSVLPKTPPKKKEETLGGKLAPAIFQTLIVTWIKANLNIIVSSHLWDELLDVLSSLTQWEELISEWAKTMETLTRVLARHVYKLDLSDLPLDRLTEQKFKRKRAATVVNRKRTEFVDSDFKSLQDTKENDNEESETARENGEKCGSSEQTTNIKRSLSDSNISYNKKLYSAKRHRYSTDSETESNIVDNARRQRPLLPRRWRSADSFRRFSQNACDSHQNSRCASPTPSSGIENSSVKDAPIQIDVMTGEQTTLDIFSEDRRSVMAGGTIRGWLPDVAVVLWRRMLGSIGNINNICNPVLHSQVYHHLIELSNTLIKMYANQGVPEDNQVTPTMPELIPPLTYFAPWCFQALQLSSDYQKGKLCAYRLLCQTTLAAPNSVLSQVHTKMFLKILRDALVSKDKNTVYTVVKYTGTKFFSRQLPGYSILIPEFVEAANTVLSSNDLGPTPRAESVSILGSILSLIEPISKFPAFENIENFSSDLKSRVLKILIYAAKKEQSGLARSIALSSLSIFLLQEISSENKHPNFKEAFNMLLLALKFNHEIIAQTACDILMMLCDYAPTILKLYPELPPRTVEVVANTIGFMIPIEDGKKRLLISLLFLLAEWTMKIPMQMLKLNRSSNSTLLLSVFKVLDEIANGDGKSTVSVGGYFNPELVKEFNSNITLDNLKTDDVNLSSLGASNLPTHLNSVRTSLKIAARMIIAHLLENLGQFPLVSGSFLMTSLVTEQDDIPGLSSTDQLNNELFNQSNIQMFVSTDNVILSFIELPSLENCGFSVPKNHTIVPSCARIILRTLNGKYCWDVSALQEDSDESDDDEERRQMILMPCLRQNKKKEEVPYSSYIPSDPPQKMMRKRPPHVLPTAENSAPDLDNLNDLLQYISYTSPEVLDNDNRYLNSASSKCSIPTDLEQQMISAILSQKVQEQEYLKQNASLLTPNPQHPRKKNDFNSDSMFSSFRLCRLLMSHFGFFCWENRKRLYLLQKDQKVLRELRNLDSQPSRETHKIAIIYVAEGQEDKISILSNTNGSQNYENFIAALAWEVELETHVGFMGGLQRNKTTGVTAPYYATSFMEVIFHVSTRMPSLTEEALLQKTRHLGNDEVHIVWSEHNRDYRRGIIPTEFCDILIVIYPLPLDLFRLQISRKPEVPYFGPLFIELVVEWRILPSLVRSIALSASRAKRSMLPFYQQYYEERYRSLETVVRNYKMNTTFEEYVAQCFSPSNSILTEKLIKNKDHSFRLFGMGNSLDSNLAHVDFLQSVETDSSHSMSSGGANVDVDTTGISPRPFKKLASKGSSRWSIIPSSTPPDSPTARNKIK